jgi:hypothetical protein
MATPARHERLPTAGPSRAIEKGGGFFVPGLEGERIRVLTQRLWIFMLAVNRNGVSACRAHSTTADQRLSDLSWPLFSSFTRGVTGFFFPGL